MTHESINEWRRGREADSKTLFGFWVYLMTDFVLFASLFAVYAVLRNSTFGGPPGAQLFSPPFVLVETLILLTSSFTCGMALLAANRLALNRVMFWLSGTFVLGALFVSLEVSEFARMIAEGNGPGRSGFLSSYFTLVGTHGLHVTVGLLWMLALMLRIARQGLTRHGMRRLLMMSLFWHFLDVVWIFIFTIVYLFGIV